jgi:hypothetical protein
MIKDAIYKIFGSTPVMVFYYDSIYDRRNRTTKLTPVIMFFLNQIFDLRIKYKREN